MGTVRRGKVFTAAGADAALDLARRKAESPSIWLRGQVYAWPPYSTLARLEAQRSVAEVSSARDRVEFFLRWVDTHPDVKKYLPTDEHAVAAAQHYGVPTYFLDFTYSPEVAFFFASDVSSPPPGPNACIYLLDFVELHERLKQAGREAVESLQLYPVVQRVPNLWRLESQAGVFLNAPGKWFEWFEMDRIEFPRPDSDQMLRSRIYPVERSALEDELDRFFQLERMKAGAAWVRRNARPEQIVEMSSGDETIHDYVVAGSQPDTSWESTLTATWGPTDAEAYAGVKGPTLGIPQALVAGGLFQQVEGNICLSLEKGIINRAQSVGFRCLFESGKLSAREAPYLESCLRRVWDGMRRLPYSDLDIAGAIAQCINLATFGIGWWFDLGGRAPDRVMSELQNDDLIRLELASSEGAYARCIAPVSDVRFALRPDLEQVLTEHGRSAAADLRVLLRVIHDPRLLFDFARLPALLAEHWIPTQAVLAREESPVFFSPLQVTRIGMP